MLAAALACGVVAAQPTPPAYQSPITVLSSEIVYTVNADGTYVRDETARIRVNTAQALQSQAQTYFGDPGAHRRELEIYAGLDAADLQRFAAGYLGAGPTVLHVVPEETR